MTNKKSDSKDLTRIEDLSEFVHQEDLDLDMQFDTLSSGSSLEDTDLSSAELDLEGLELPETPLEEESDLEPYQESSLEGDDFLPEMPTDSPEEEIAFEATSIDEVHLGESSLNSIDPLELPETKEDENSDDFFSFNSGAQNEIQNDVLPDVSIGRVDEDMFQNYDAPTSAPEEVYTNTSERFDDIKDFAQNFSYGKTSLAGGNPPYTIIARHIRFKEDADDIVNILEEFGVINEKNKQDIMRSIELGSLIIPQISEYTAIVLAHKLRRFDLDLQVGLSDEVHPSKSGEINHKGLLKKDSLKQNRIESLKFSEVAGTIQDIIVTTTATLPGYAVESYIGVQTTFSIIEESDLEKLEYVEKAQRDHAELFAYNGAELETKEAFKNYQNSFSMLYNDLTMQLKQKAFAQKANALLGLSFQLSPLHFERAKTRVNAYQITCSATLAVVSKERD